MYPGEYLPHYPEGVRALNLTLGAESLDAALEADCAAVWSTIEPGMLYWIPGTRIIGVFYTPHSTRALPAALENLPPPAVDCHASPPRVPFIYSTGHGNIVTSRMVGEGFGLCEDIHCRLVAVHSINLQGLEFLNAQSSWVDVQQHAWFSPVPVATSAAGPIAAAYGTEIIALTPDHVRAIEHGAQNSLSFFSAGNGVPVTTHFEPILTPSVVMVGGHDNGYPIARNGLVTRPAHVASDVCKNWVAVGLDKYAKSGGGTSISSPFAAGGAAAILLEARRILGDAGGGVHDGVVASGDPPAGLSKGPLADGKFTLAEWKTLLFRTATPRPEYQHSDGDRCPEDGTYDSLGGPSWQEIPEEVPGFIDIGYGAIDNRSVAFAIDVLHGRAELPDRSVEDAYFAVDRQWREMWYAINTFA